MAFQPVKPQNWTNLLCWFHNMSDHVTNLSKKKGNATKTTATAQEVPCFGNDRDNGVFNAFSDRGFNAFIQRPQDTYATCCLLKRTSLTSIHKLLINLIVVHQVNITVLNSLWWQICTDGVISRLGDDKSVFLQRLQERKQTTTKNKQITNTGWDSCPLKVRSPTANFSLATHFLQTHLQSPLLGCTIIHWTWNYTPTAIKICEVSAEYWGACRQCHLQEKKQRQIH